MYPTLFITPGLKGFAEEIDAERQAQITKWGDQRHPDGTGSDYYARKAATARRNEQLAANEPGVGTNWALILLEEVYEAVAEDDSAKLRAELIQVAAVCAGWVSDLDRRTEGPAA